MSASIVDEFVTDHQTKEPRLDETVAAQMSAKISETIEPAAEPETKTVSDGDLFGASESKPSTPVDVFDPALHETNDDGSPRLTKEGKFRRKRGNKSKNGNGNGNGNGANTNTNPNPNPNPTFDAASVDSIAGMFVTVVTCGLTATLGPKWKETSEEYARMKDATNKYLIATGATEFPPELLLVMAFGTYALPRFLTGDKTTKTVENTANV